MSAGAPDHRAWIEVETGDSLAGAIIRTPCAIVTGAERASISSFEGALLQAEVVIGAGVDLSRCRFGDAIGLAQLRFVENPFARVGRRYVIADESEHAYRELRQAAEASRLYELAADLHIGELQQRARRSSPLLAFGWQVFGVVGGWGHRPLRPFLWWWAMCAFITVLITTWPQRFVGGDFVLGGALVDEAHWQTIFFRFVTRHALAVLTPIEYGDIHSDGYALFLVSKMLTIVLGVFMAMGLRSRLRR